MKYIEQVKTTVLTVLVLLSIALTFFIWTYTPNYKPIEQSETEEIVIGEKKEIDDILKPYKAIFHLNNEWKGTVSTDAMDELMTSFQQWEATNFIQIDTEIAVPELNDMMREDKRFTIFFMGEIPLQVFHSVMPFVDQELPEVTFNRIIVDWEKYESKELDLYFVSTENMYVYRSTVQLSSATRFYDKIINLANEYGVYKEVEREAAPSLFVIDEEVEAIKYTYYTDEIKPERFKNVLFADPNLVQRNVDSTQSEKYTDGMSLMTVDTSNKTLNYVYPAAESSTHIVPSKLLRFSFDFINEHGGITADYRYAWMNKDSHQIDYIHFLQGLPVVSYETSTRLSTTWGDNRAFRYKRPYYSLDMDITSEKEITALPSGQEIVRLIHSADNVVLSALDEVMVGYYLSKAEDQNLYILEPSWFYVRDGSWVRITPEMFGGAASGLE